MRGSRRGDLIAYYQDGAGARPPPPRPAVHDEALSRRLAGRHLLPEGRALRMPEWIPTFSYRSTSRQTREKRTLRYPLVNDELALVWMANMGCIDMNTWYSRAGKPQAAGGCSSTSTSDGDQVPRGRAGGAPRQGRASTRSACGPSQDERLRRLPRARADPAAPPTGRRASSPRSSPGRSPACTTRDNRVGEGEAPRRAHRLEPERRGKDDRLSSVRPNAGGPVSTPLRWEEVTEDLDNVFHDGGRSRPGRARRRSVRGRVGAEAGARPALRELT